MGQPSGNLSDLTRGPRIDRISANPLFHPGNPSRLYIVIAGWTVPQCASVPGLILPGVLSAWGFVLAARSDSRNLFSGKGI